MEGLFTLFSRYKIAGEDEFELFEKFYQNNVDVLNRWFEFDLLEHNYKDDVTSETLRQDGNEIYIKNRLEKSIQYYTRALCKATYKSGPYGLALANRSAAFFKLKEYENCLKDIDSCLESKYPKYLLTKIYIRRLDCYYELGLEKPFNEFLEETLSFINGNGDMTAQEKEKTIEKLLTYQNLLPKQLQKETAAEVCILPELLNGENESFSSASSSIRMSYTKEKGRHVVANEDIKMGSVLFVEKAFIFAPIFTEKCTLIPRKCYNCLSDLRSSIPCKTCPSCLYCDQTCRDNSWLEFHRWECKGMAFNLWYYLGIGFPAFRALLKGLKSGYNISKGNKECVENFGDKSDNYPYFNSLLSNIHKMENVTPILVLAAVIVTYLKFETNFLSCVRSKFPTTDTNTLYTLIGGILTRHMAQLSCNSSVIQHWGVISKDALPIEKIKVACGIYPSVSIMNHSCRPNVSMYFVKDVLVVKALENISENEEIFNCYGVDFRRLGREARQEKLLSLYSFTCKCSICVNPSLEVGLLDSYLCPKCKGQVCFEESKCVKCGTKVNLRNLRSLEEQANELLSRNDDELTRIDKYYNMKKLILVETHDDIDECYAMYQTYYLSKGDVVTAMEYFKKSLDLNRRKLGNNARSIGEKLIKTLPQFTGSFENLESIRLAKNRTLIMEVDELFQEAKEILSLYYNEKQIHLADLEQNIECLKFCI